MFRSHGSTTAAAVSTLGAIATALVLTAANAPAAITNFAVAPGNSPIFVNGCTYNALALATPGDYVSFYDSQDGEFNPPGAILVGPSGEVTAQWTPRTPGMHMLHSVQIGDERTIGIEVSTGGAACP